MPGDQLTDGADGLRSCKMTKIIIKRFEPIKIKDQQRQRGLIYPGLIDECRDACFEGAQIVQPGQIISDCQQAHSLSVIGQLSGDDPDAEEKNHLNDVAFILLKMEEPGVLKMVKQYRGERDDHGPTTAKPGSRKNNRKVVEVLKWEVAGGMVDQ